MIKIEGIGFHDLQPDIKDLVARRHVEKDRRWLLEEVALNPFIEIKNNIICRNSIEMDNVSTLNIALKMMWKRFDIQYEGELLTQSERCDIYNKKDVDLSTLLRARRIVDEGIIYINACFKHQFDLLDSAYAIHLLGDEFEYNKIKFTQDGQIIKK